MGRRPTKAADNPFCKARLEAAKYNEKLFSKECASELLGVSVSTLSDYELGLTKIVPPGMVVKMAALYNAPELENYYCTEMCPLGCGMPKASVEDLDRITINLLSLFQDTDRIGKLLLGITKDGVVTEDEMQDMRKILSHLDDLEKAIQDMGIWVRKNLKQSGNMAGQSE